MNLKFGHTWWTFHLALFKVCQLKDKMWPWNFMEWSLLDKRTWWKTSFLNFSDLKKNWILTVKLQSQSSDLFNDLFNCHHFTKGIFGTNFNFMPCLEVKIPEWMYISTPCSHIALQERYLLDGWNLSIKSLLKNDEK